MTRLKVIFDNTSVEHLEADSYKAPSVFDAMSFDLIARNTSPEEKGNYYATKQGL
jgi:hypothetical protein